MCTCLCVYVCVYLSHSDLFIHLSMQTSMHALSILRTFHVFITYIIKYMSIYLYECVHTYRYEFRFANQLEIYGLNKLSYLSKSFLISLSQIRNLSSKTYLPPYIYIYICVCVCVCVCIHYYIVYLPIYIYIYIMLSSPCVYHRISQLTVSSDGHGVNIPREIKLRISIAFRQAISPIGENQSCLADDNESHQFRSYDPPPACPPSGKRNWRNNTLIFQ